MEMKDLVKLYPVSKTLRFELTPVSETWDNLEKCNYLENDRDRSQKYDDAKKCLDQNHRDFINELLSKSDFNWKSYCLALINRRKNASDAESKKLLEKCQSDALKYFTTAFKKDARFKGLFAKPAIERMLSISREQEDQVNIEALEAFDRFSVYFTGYHTNRKNIYSSEKGSVAYRIAIENFPKFVDNMLIFETIREKNPEIIETLKKNLKVSEELGITDIEDCFALGSYNKLITQEGIEYYNYVLGGNTTETEKIQGLNELLNLEHQKNPEFKRVQMKPLYNQILSVHGSRSYIPIQFKNSEELMSAVERYVSEVEQSGVTATARKLIEDISEYDAEHIFIEQSNLARFSKDLLGSWDALSGKLQFYYADKLGDPQMIKCRAKVEKSLKADRFSLQTIIDAVKLSEEFSFERYFGELNRLCESIGENTIPLRELSITDFSALPEDEREIKVATLRQILESYLELLHMLRTFEVDDGVDSDQTFYSALNEAVEKLSPIVPLFNKARNFFTKKAYDTSKFKVNLKFPTLCDGWDLNKEKDNHAILLRKDGLYYLGVVKNGQIKQQSPISSGETVFEKMDYKLVPDPSKMLPKIFVKAKSSGKYGLTDELLAGYDAGKHVKGQNFDLNFCHELIDYYKKGIAAYKDWEIFGFRFSDTDTYPDLSAFYKEVSDQGYKVSMSKISAADVYRMVREGSLFLFKLSNKDFNRTVSTGGKDNLHTMYWKALFSQENLEEPVIKLSGQAELFFRKASIKASGHGKGSVLVNKRTKTGLPVPDNIYKELMGYYNHSCADLSDEAEKYLPLVAHKRADKDIVKDRRFTVDKMFFHVPIMFNFREGHGDMALDRSVIDSAVSDNDLKIIGIDRGERNLLYYSIIDHNGKILKQGSLNTIDGYDYRGALNVREIGKKEAQRNWGRVEGIKQFKEGYLSKAVSELTRMIIDNNAILVMEDLNYGFKRGRIGIEKQVYQKFENMLISKMNYLVLKDRSLTEEGGPLKGYQLTRPQGDVSQSVRQTGVIFYVPAAYTSKIDPTTGFANLFSFGEVPDNIEGKKQFLSRFKSIRFDPSENKFAFSFDYRDFNTSVQDSRNLWTAYTVGVRAIYVKGEYVMKDPTEMIKHALSESECDLNAEITEKLSDLSGSSIRTIFDAFKLTVAMRVENKTEDYIQSPVKNRDGEFYCSKDSDGKTPIDSDANGAYNIALKGELMLRMSKESLGTDPTRYAVPYVHNNEWLAFVQSGMKEWKN